TFLEDDFDKVYDSEKKLSMVSRNFAIISIVISSLGLLGLAMFSYERRAKEISIRRVLGASEGNTIVLLAREFTILILLALIIALPIGYYFSDVWLQNFANAMELNFFHFGLAALIAIAIGWITIGFQAWKSIQVNPAKMLRSE
ncbi:MAG: FtsX-like permease family protein, partial [Bacteroidota bacterium]